MISWLIVVAPRAWLGVGRSSSAPPLVRRSRSRGVLRYVQSARVEFLGVGGFGGIYTTFSLLFDYRVAGFASSVFFFPLVFARGLQVCGDGLRCVFLSPPVQWAQDSTSLGLAGLFRWRGRSRTAATSAGPGEVQKYGAFCGAVGGRTSHDAG